MMKVNGHIAADAV